MIHFITYGNEKFTQSKKRIYKEAVNCGWFDTITIYEPKDLEKEFQNKYKDILKLPRIGGYGIWRPHIIEKKLNEISDNDFLIYLDAGCTINKKGEKKFYEYLDLLHKSDEGIISFQMCNHIEKYYTTKEIFNYFNVKDNTDITNTGQILDGILIMKKNKVLIEIIKKWNKVIYDNVLLFTDFYNKKQEPYFIDNRHEQSILSIIRKLGNPILLSDETWFNFGDEKSLHYPFWATRKRV